MSRGWDPWTERPLPEVVRVTYPPDAIHNDFFLALVRQRRNRLIRNGFRDPQPLEIFDQASAVEALSSPASAIGPLRLTIPDPLEGDTGAVR
jgi:hypothetical protein